jgi:GH24 family phage-related lysozyme (muramidase)
MKTFKQFLNENNIAQIATSGIASAALAAPPKPEARSYIVDLMKKKEGFRPVAEIDKDATQKQKKDVIVVGHGTTFVYPDTGKPIKVGDPITKEKAEELINVSIDKVITPQMEKIPGWDDMHSGQQASLLSFAYNLGQNFYGDKDFKKITTALKNKEWDKVPETMKLYNKSGKKVLAGLVTRRQEEADLWTHGFPSNKKQETTSTGVKLKPYASVEQIKPVGEILQRPYELGNAFKSTSTNNDKQETEYTIQKGDTLTKIAGNDPEKLKTIIGTNNIKDPNKIQVGQKIKIPK